MITEIIKYFTFHKQALSQDLEKLMLARLYSFLGTIGVPLVVLATINFQKPINLSFNIFFALSFAFILFGTYRIRIVKYNAHNFLFALFLIICFYNVSNSFFKGNNYNELFAIITTIFIFSSVIDTSKKLIIFYVFNISIISISLVLSNDSDINLSYFLSYLIIFFFISLMVNKSAITTKLKLETKENFLNTLFNESADPYLVINTNTNLVIDCNLQALSLFKIKDKGDIIGFSGDKYQKYKNKKEVWINIKDKLIQGEIFNKNIVFIDSSGKEFIGDTKFQLIQVEKEQYFFVRIINISKRLEEENKLINSERKYRSLFEDSLAGVFKIKLDGEILEINKSFAKMFGYSLNELKSSNSSILFHNPEDREEYLRLFLSKDNQQNNSFNLKKKDGSNVQILVNSELKDNYNESYIEGTAIDITALKIAEVQFKDSEDRFKRLSEASFEGICIHQEGQILDANNAFCNLIGFAHEELVGKDGFQLISSKLKENFQQLTHSELPREVDLYTSSGEKLNVIIRGKKIPYDGSTATVTSLRNITIEKEITKALEKEKIRAEVAEESKKELTVEIIRRQKIEQELTKTENFLSNIIDSSLDIIISTDIDGKITNFNKAAENAFGYKKDEILGKQNSILFENTEDQNRLKEQLNGTEAKFYGEITNLDKNGKSFISFISASRLIDKEGNAIGSMGVSRDITNVKLAEEKLKASEENYRDLFENATNMIQSVDNKGNILFVNKAWKSTLGYFEDNEIIGNSIFNFIEENCRERCKLIFSDVYKGKIIDNVEVNFITKSNKIITAVGNISGKEIGGQIIRTRGIFTDITDRLYQAEEIKKGLKEKEILLAEIHHRVKNNLQVISSMLNLQSNYVEDTNTLEILKDSQNRVKSMSFIHEDLYQNKDFSKIDFSS